jgi:GT2 family glycosyltransferase
MTDGADVESPSVLIVVSPCVDSDAGLDPVLQTLAAVRGTAPEAMVLVVDRSPEPQAALLKLAADELGCAYAPADTDGETAALNVGLRAAVAHGMHVALVAPGIVPEPGWLGRLLARTGTDGAPAAVAGGVTIEPTGVIRQAGYYFTLFRRTWGARLWRVPEIMLDVTTPALVPTSLELQLIRREWIEQVGELEEHLDGVYAGLDYCLRVSAAGGQSVLEPTARGRALEPPDDEDIDDRSTGALRLRVKHPAMSFHTWAPEVL